MASTLEHTATARVGRPVRPAGILGLGTALPERVVTNAEVADRIGQTEEWIHRRTGITERRYAAPGTELSSLAADAGRAALLDAGVAGEDIDLVLVASFSQDSRMPNAAPVVANRLGATRAGAFDVGSACTGFVAALGTASALIGVGDVDTALVIGAEIISRHLDPHDRKTAMLFGDGAGAVVLRADGPGSIGPCVLGADGANAQLIVTDPEHEIIAMDGHETFRQALVRLPEASLAACAAAGLTLADIDLFIYHQANHRIIVSLIEKLALPAERVVDCIAEHGNTSAASVPLALGHARQAGQLRPGMTVLLAAVGAGFTWGATVIEWGRA